MRARPRPCGSWPRCSNPSWGEATVCGYSIYTGSKEIRRVIGYMPDFFGVYDDMKVIEYLEFFASAYRIKGPARRKICEEVLELVDLTYKRDALVTSLSRGMTQRLGLARTLLHDPQVLLLDEPASGLDPRARIEMRALLKELRSMGKTILVSSHILPELADICNKIGIIEQGKLLVNGEVTDVMKQVRTDIVLNIAVSERMTDAACMLEGQPEVETRRGQERRPGGQAPRGRQPVRLPRQPAGQPGLRADPFQGRRDQPRDRLHAPDQGDHELIASAPLGVRRLLEGQSRIHSLGPLVVEFRGSRRMNHTQPGKQYLYREAVRATWLGLAVNLALGSAKLLGGMVGQSYALISDAVQLPRRRRSPPRSCCWRFGSPRSQPTPSTPTATPGPRRSPDRTSRSWSSSPRSWWAGVRSGDPRSSP